jgi:hypothetical protein
MILQLLMWAVLQSTHEVFTYVVYINEYLKPQIGQLLPEPRLPFLDFESFISKLRRKWFLRFETRFGLSIVVFAGMIALTIIALYNTPPPRLCNQSTLGWGVANSYMLFILTGKSFGILRLQKRADTEAKQSVRMTE